LVEGGAIVTLVVSHTVADAGALIESITAAVDGTARELNYPVRGARTRRQALRADLAVTARALREVPAAGDRSAKLAPEHIRRAVRVGKATPARGRRAGVPEPVDLPPCGARRGGRV
jgi:hypothetical protein